MHFMSNAAEELSLFPWCISSRSLWQTGRRCGSLCVQAIQPIAVYGGLCL